MTDDDGAQRREEQVLLRQLAAAGITQVDVSIMLGVGEPAISAWAQGHKRPNPDNLEALRALVEQAEAPPGTANGVQAELETGGGWRRGGPWPRSARPRRCVPRSPANWPPCSAR